MLIRRMYLSIKRECVALIFFLFCGFLFTETRKETSGIPYLTQGVVICYNIYTIYSMGDYGNMKCPYCAHDESKVIDSRPTEEGEKIRRRRECLQCGKRFTTYEVIESVPVLVVKRDKSREAFDSQKLLNGMLRACEKRPVEYATLEKAVSEIEATIQNSFEREVTSEKIGELAMDKLKNIDEVAYVRFASVYRQFTDVSTFIAEVNKLLNR